MLKTGPRIVASISAVLLSSLALGTATRAQMAVPAAKPPSGEDLFKRQCATCHATKAGEAQRQGPMLAGVVGRKPGSVEGFHYSPGFAKADWVWDEQHLDTWLTNPQAMIPGAIMPYKQAKPEIRTAIIGYLKELH